MDVVFDCTARSVGKMRCEMEVRIVEPELIAFELASDEYGYHGGEGTAPLPIAYFVAGLTSCLMTQIRAFAKRLRIEIGDVEIVARCAWEAVQQGRAPYVTAPTGFALDIRIDSDAPAADLIRLVEAGKQGCFIEQTLARANTIDHRLRIGDVWVKV